MSASLSRYLKDFSPPKFELTRVTPRYFPDLDTDLSQNRAWAEPVMPEIDVDAERSEAFAKGRAEASAELALEHQKEIADLKAFKQYFTDLRAAVKKGVDAGMTRDRAVKEIKLPQYSSYAGYEQRLPANVAVVYDEMKSGQQ